MKFIQHAQAQLSNGTNISVEAEPDVIILNKTLRIPLRELPALCKVLLTYAPVKPGRRRTIKDRAQEVAADTLLRWTGPVGKEIAHRFPREGTKIRRISEAISASTLGPIERKVLHERLCAELKLSPRQVGTGTSALIHHFKFLKVVIQR